MAQRWRQRQRGDVRELLDCGHQCQPSGSLHGGGIQCRRHNHQYRGDGDGSGASGHYGGSRQPHRRGGAEPEFLGDRSGRLPAGVSMAIQQCERGRGHQSDPIHHQCTHHPKRPVQGVGFQCLGHCKCQRQPNRFARAGHLLAAVQRNRAGRRERRAASRGLRFARVAVPVVSLGVVQRTVRLCRSRALGCERCDERALYAHQPATRPVRLVPGAGGERSWH